MYSSARARARAAENDVDKSRLKRRVIQRATREISVFKASLKQLYVHLAAR